MLQYTLRRLINLVPTFLLATFLAWMVVEVSPGDFATQFAFDQVDPERADRIRQALGLHLPWWQRYFAWLYNLIANLSFGVSMTTRNEAMQLVWPRMLNSLWLLLPATLLTYLISIPIGVYSAVRQYSLGDRVLTIFSLIGLAVPNFFLALLVLASAVQFYQTNGYFLIPTGGMTSQNHAELTFVAQALDLTWHLLAPVLIVTTAGLATLTRVMRGQMLEVMGQDYIRTARAKGLSERVVTYKHALKNAILVIIATIGNTLPSLLLGAGTVEYVMRWPGLTPLFIRAIFAQDLYIVMALLTVGILLLMVGNLIADLSLALVDPRIRY
jgi:peptide/nickel transport system permease protein